MRVLFLCSHNSARSQMAEGFLRAMGGDRFVVESAGTRATRVHPLAIEAMREAGIDISGQRSKTVDDVGEGWDVVVTVCDANCPIPPRSGMKLSWHFPDPSAASGSEAERLAAFRAVRDGIRSQVALLAERIDGGTPPARHPGRTSPEVTTPRRALPMQEETTLPGNTPGQTGKQGGQTDIGKKGGDVGMPGQHGGDMDKKRQEPGKTGDVKP